MIIKPTAWMQELPKEEGVERAVRTTTVREVAEDWGNPIPLYTADDLQDAVLAEREACAEVAESYEPTCDTCPSGVANAIRARGET
jgi:hypothetical protein